MRRFAVGAVFVAVVALLAAAVSAAPQMTLKEDDFNFGFAPQNARISHYFWVYSTGDQDLKISKVVPGCGCTQTPLEKELLTPGDSARLEIIFSTGRYKNQVSKHPKVYANDGPVAKTIMIHSYVVERPDSTYPVIVAPYKLDLSQFGQKVRGKMDFTIDNVSDQDLKLTMVSQPSDIATIELPKEIKAGKSATGKVTLTEKGIDLSFDKSFTFEVNDVKTSRFTVPLTRDRLGAEAEPAADLKAGGKPGTNADTKAGPKTDAKAGTHADISSTGSTH